MSLWDGVDLGKHFYRKSEVNTWIEREGYGVATMQGVDQHALLKVCNLQYCNISVSLHTPQLTTVSVYPLSWGLPAQTEYYDNSIS